MTTNENRDANRFLSDDEYKDEQFQNSAQSSFLDREITRRGFVTAVGAVTGGVCLGVAIPFQNAGPMVLKSELSITVDLNLMVNGRSHALTVDPRVTLLDLLRENLALTGSKKGCDHGQCGACTVLANDRRINSCLSLAVVHDGEEITTIEGIAKGQELHPLQTAFLEQDGFQCGYCTPGQICSAVALFEEHKRGDASFVTKQLASGNASPLTADEIRERMSGNICRCGAYRGIVSAIQSVSQVQRDRTGE